MKQTTDDRKKSSYTSTWRRVTRWNWSFQEMGRICFCSEFKINEILEWRKEKKVEEETLATVKNRRKKQKDRKMREGYKGLQNEQYGARSLKINIAMKILKHPS